MKAYGRRARQRGWSLLELSLVIAIAGLLGLVLWGMLALAPRVAGGDTAARDLGLADQALLGYALAHHRLPAPVQIDGAGMLPVEVLGLPARLRLRYQVQPVLSQQPYNRYEPVLPPAEEDGVPVASGQVNGLDLCMALKAVAQDSLAGMERIPAAYALMHAGSAGSPSPPAPEDFVLPGGPAVGERRVLAIGPNEFAARLNCPDRVARVQAASRAALAAYDMARVARGYQQLRALGIRVAQADLEQARAGEIFAGFDVAYVVSLESRAFLQVAGGWPPDPASTAAGVAALVAITPATITAAVNLNDAVQARKEAADGVEDAEDKHAVATATLERMRALAASALQRARELDAAGLQP